MLVATGIIIPLFSPVKIILEPASFTLASHVPIFLSMFISPSVAASVSLGTTLGFFLGGFPLIIVLRAATHIVFAVIGSMFLQKHSQLMSSTSKLQIFSFLIGTIHAACEVLVVSLFYFNGDVSSSYYAQGFITSVLLLVGIGSILHSMLDFGISLILLKTLIKQPLISKIFRLANFTPPQN